MKDAKTIALIKELSDAPGISGFEDEVLPILRREGAGLGSFEEDCMRNLYLGRKENRQGKVSVMLDAHTDEVGFMIKAIRPDGMLEFITIGGWVVSNIPAHLVKVMTSDGTYIPGVVATKPPHFMSEAERNAPLSLSSLAIDIGAVSDVDVHQHYHVLVGAPVVPDVTCTFQEERGIFIGKAFDNRLGSAAIIETLKAVEGVDLSVNVIGAFASQEEVGTRGATVTASHVNPSLVICFEGCPADDTVSLPSYQVQSAMGKGPMLRYIDQKMITNPRFQRYALSVAEKEGIPVQCAVRTGGATDGAPIHLSGMGIPVIVIGFPVRYAHTHYGLASLADFKAGVALACHLLSSLDAETIAGF